ncbi:hypothetical protein [Streptosporangium sp. G12]
MTHATRAYGHAAPSSPVEDGRPGSPASGGETLDGEVSGRGTFRAGHDGPREARAARITVETTS